MEIEIGRGKKGRPAYGFDDIAIVPSRRTRDQGMATLHPSLQPGARVTTMQDDPLEEILLGPAHGNHGTFDLIGALRTSMATCGYEDIRDFQRAEVMVAPALQTEGKQLPREQSVGMGSNGHAVVSGGVTVTDG